MAYYDQQSNLLGDITNFFKGLMGNVVGLTQLTPQFDYNKATAPVVNAQPTWQQVFDQVYKAQELGLDVDDTTLKIMLGLSDDPRGSDYAHQFTSYGHPGRDETLTWEQLQQMGNISRDDALQASTAYQDLLGQVSQAGSAQQYRDLANTFRDNFNATLNGESGNIQDLINRIQQLGNTPVYDDATINRLTGEARSNTGLGADNAIKAIEQNLASRGIAGSGVQSDLSGRVYEDANRTFSGISNNILNEAQRTNREGKERALGLEASLASVLDPLKFQANQFATGLEAGAITNFDPTSIFNAISQIGQNSAYTDFLNQSLNQGALRDMQAQQQQMFENMLSLGSLFKGNDSGGGKKSGGGFLGNLGLNANTEGIGLSLGGGYK